MAYVNVRDWLTDQVVDWLKGLDGIVTNYLSSFLNNGVTGQQLLILRCDDLENLGVKILAHQEIILECIEHLRHFHFELDKENLQLLALKVSCSSQSLYKELLLVDADSLIISPQMISDVHNIISSVKRLVYWLDLAPFAGDKSYVDIKTELLELTFEMATRAHRGKFSEKPVSSIQCICEKITKIADHLIKEVSDPMILHPASLALATLKKKEQELGFFISPCNHPIHQIAEIKYGSPAHGSTKIEEGDEIVQVNYQTVVGWQRKNVMILLQEAPPEIVLTLKKRPRHTKVYGQVYVKPYRLPSKKLENQTYFRWGESITPARLLPIPNLSPVAVPKLTAVIEPADFETELSSSDDSEQLENSLEERLPIYPLKPRPVLQRRNTITGLYSSSKRSYPFLEQYWQLQRGQNTSTYSSTCTINKTNFDLYTNFYRDKSASCNLELELNSRPSTVIGIGQNDTKNFFKNNSKDRSIKRNVYFKPQEQIEMGPKNSEESCVSINSLTSLRTEAISFIDEGRELTDRSSMVPSNKDTIEPDFHVIVDKKHQDEALSAVNIHDMINKFDHKSDIVKPKIYPRSQVKKPPDVPQKPDSTKKPLVPPRSASIPVKSQSTAVNYLNDGDSKYVDKSIMKFPDRKLIEPSEAIETGVPKENIVVVGMAINESLAPRNIDSEEYKKCTNPMDPLIKLRNELLQEPSMNFLENEQLNNTGAIKDETLKNDKDSICKSNEYKSTPTKKIEDISDPDLCNKKCINTDKSIGDNKISPTNSIVRAMIYSNKNKVGKKKNSIIAKRRQVTVADLNPPDIHGFLYQRLRGKHNPSIHWEKRWFVLMGSYFYGFKRKDDSRAACLIFLSGFTVALASEVKSRSNAFKVYHTGTVFYFSAENSEILQQWVESITAATMNNDQLKLGNTRLYSETDESDNEKAKIADEIRPLEPIKKFDSLKKVSSKKHDTPSGSTSLDRKRFFKKCSSNTKSSVPVPTAQFRSYRKIKSNQTSVTSVTTGNFTSHVTFFTPKYDTVKLQQSTQNVSVPNLTVDILCKNEESTKNIKVKPKYYAHASNPSLCNQSNLDNGNFLKKALKPCNGSLAGFVTLEELMIKQSEEQKCNPYNQQECSLTDLNFIQPDVVYGEVPIRPKEKVHCGEDNLEGLTKINLSGTSDSSNAQKENIGSSCFGKRLGSFKKKYTVESNSYEGRTATYPKTVKSFDQNEKLDKTTIYSSDRNLSYVDKGYEMIYCPETTSNVHFAHNRNLEDTMYTDPEIKKLHNFSSKKIPKSVFPRYTNQVSDCSTSKLKQVSESSKVITSTKQDFKTRTKLTLDIESEERTNKGNKLKHIFGKQTDVRKEKTLLGSPKLHRTIFRKNNTEIEHNLNSSPLRLSDSTYSLEKLPSIESIPMNVSPHKDYPGLEYPPVFEAETYSLADPQSSLTLLRKQGKSNI